METLPGPTERDTVGHVREREGGRIVSDLEGCVFPLGVTAGEFLSATEVFLLWYFLTGKEDWDSLVAEGISCGVPSLLTSV